jgi:hypothetical protein
VCSLELIPQIPAAISIIAKAGGITIVICIALWLLFCRWVIKDAVKRGDKPDAVELIRATSLGMIGRSPKPPQLPSAPSDKPPKKRAA